MILFHTAWNNIKNNKLIHFFIILQMSAVLIITAIMSSAIMIRYQYYYPFQDIWNHKGLFVYYGSLANKDPNTSTFPNMLNNQDILSELPNSNEVISCHIPLLSSGDFQFKSYSYDDDLIRRFKPKMRSGVWLDAILDQEPNNSYAQAVVSENEYGWKTGDIITIDCVNYPESFKLNVEIIGVMEDNVKIVGGEITADGDLNYNKLFSLYSYDIERIPLLLFSHDALNNIESATEHITEDAVVQAISSNLFILYPDETDDAIIQQDKNTVLNYCFGFAVPITEMQENNSVYLKKQLYNFLPIIIILLILASVSSISTSAISVRRNLKDYAIFYINGLQWKQCIIVNLIQSLILLFYSDILTIILLLIIHESSFNWDMTITINKYFIISSLLFSAMFVFFSMLMPILMIGKSTPKQILTR